MSRVPEVLADDLDPVLRRSLQDSGCGPGTLQWRSTATLAHAPHILSANTKWMTEAMTNRILDRRLLELVRLRLTYYSQCRSCMAMRFKSAYEEGLTEDLVCSLEKPAEAENLTDREKLAIEYADVFCTDHYSIGDEWFEKLRKLFTHPEIIELGMFVGFFHGTGKFLATLDMTEELPEVYQDKSKKILPWHVPGEVVAFEEFER